MLSKQKVIKKYLDDKGYTGTDCVYKLTTKETNEIYDLYIHNDDHNYLTTNKPGYYGVYYEIKKLHDKMVICHTRAIEKDCKDYGPLNTLYEYWKEHSDFPSKISKVCDLLEKNNPKEYQKFNKLRIISLKNNPEPRKVVEDPFDKINNLIKTFLDNNETDKVYELYEKCDTDDMKKKYFIKVMDVPNFILSKIMICDIMKLDFDKDAPVELGLIKCTYAGYNLENIELEYLMEKYNNATDDKMKKNCLIKLVKLKDFKPTKRMIIDIFRLEFDKQESLEINLFKAIFSGYDLKKIELEYFYEQYKKSTDDDSKKKCLIEMVKLKDFKPTKEMVQDMFRLNFDKQESLEINLLKSVFAGMHI